jgi:hypothetical protein
MGMAGCLRHTAIGDDDASGPTDIATACTSSITASIIATASIVVTAAALAQFHFAHHGDACEQGSLPAQGGVGTKTSSVQVFGTARCEAMLWHSHTSSWTEGASSAYADGVTSPCVHGGSSACALGSSACALGLGEANKATEASGSSFPSFAARLGWLYRATGSPSETKGGNLVTLEKKLKPPPLPAGVYRHHLRLSDECNAADKSYNPRHNSWMYDLSAAWHLNASHVYL